MMASESQSEAERGDKMRALARRHACRIGEVVMAWGYFQFILAVWYTTLTSPADDVSEAFKQWDKTLSDSRQREMLVEALKAKRDRNPEAFDSMVWVCEWANELARIRNAFVHVGVVFRGLPDSPQIAFLEQLHLGGDDRHKHVKEKPDESYDALISDLPALSEFAHRTFNAVLFPDKFGPNPARPALLTEKVFPDIKPKSLG